MGWNVSYNDLDYIIPRWGHYNEWTGGVPTKLVSTWLLLSFLGCTAPSLVLWYLTIFLGFSLWFLSNTPLLTYEPTARSQTLLHLLHWEILNFTKGITKGPRLTNLVLRCYRSKDLLFASNTYSLWTLYFWLKDDDIPKTYCLDSYYTTLFNTKPKSILAKCQWLGL